MQALPLAELTPYAPRWKQLYPGRDRVDIQPSYIADLSPKLFGVLR